MNVSVLERKTGVGAKLHPTGNFVKDAIEQVALLDALPGGLVRRIHGVRVEAPNMRHVDLLAPGYYLLATDTAELMRWLAGRAEAASARIEYGSSFTTCERNADGFDLGNQGHALPRRRCSKAILRSTCCSPHAPCVPRLHRFLSSQRRFQSAG
jgi:flavin-dependent dehydrogenase